MVPTIYIYCMSDLDASEVSAELPPIEVLDYTEKSIVVRGDTKPYKSHFQGLRGLWNANLTDETGSKFGGWIYPKKQTNDVLDLVDRINAGEVTPEPVTPSPDRGGRRLAPATRAEPTSRTPPRSVPGPRTPPRKKPQVPAGSKMAALTPSTQTLSYVVPLPKVGATAKIVYEAGSTIPVKITELISGKTGGVDAVYASPHDSEDIYKLAVTAGEWQVVGILEDHTISFTE